MTFTLLVLCRNEIEGLKIVAPRLKKEWVDEVLVVDGGSTDGSIEFCEAQGWTVLRQKSTGILAGVVEGIQAAKGDMIIGFTPDNNMIPEKIPEIVAKAKEGYDLVICSRYAKGAKSDDDSQITGFGNWMFTTMVNVLFKAHYTDVLGFYRAFKKSLIEEIGYENIMISLDTQMCILCAKKGYKVTEIPGDEPPRIGGASSRSIIRNGVIELYTILSEFVKR